MRPKIAITLLFCLAAAVVTQAQNVTPTKGREFWFGFMKNYEVESNWEALDVFIVSDQNTSGTITVPGQGWSQSFTVSANVTTTVTVPNNIGETLSNQLVEGKGILVETEDTVAVFAINFNGYTADANKILPTQTLGTEYRVSAYQGLDGYSYNSEFLVVATEDDTEVEITPSAPTMGGNAAGVPFTVQLDEGEVYQVRAASWSDDFTGTVIHGTSASGSCRPFAVFSGSDCTNIPWGCYACDHVCEENFPTETWGNVFHLVPFEGTSSYTYTILADQDNTSVSIDGGAAFILNAGQYTEYNDVQTALCVEADKGICVTQFMEGLSCADYGDPAMLILNDENQKIDNITFSTVTSAQITGHKLNLIIKTADIGLVTLDGSVIPASEFQAFNACATHSWAQMDLTAGSHTLDASIGDGVTAYVYGWGSAESYAYSVGSFSPLPPIIIDEAICTNDTVQLQITGNYYAPYWYNYTSPEDTLAEGYTYIIIPPIENGIYVGVGNEFVSGCSEEFYFSVEVPDPPVIDVFQSAYQICQYQQVQLNAVAYPESAVYLYSWSPTAGLDDPGIQNPIATPLETTTYTVTVTTPTGCGTNTADVTIQVLDGDITSFTATPEEVLFCSGDGAQLQAETQTEVFSDNFDPGISWGSWSDINNGTANSTCGSVTGNGLYFDGNGERSAITNGLNVVNGGTVYFSLKVASEVAPCDNAEPGDNIELSYSTNNGGSWTPIQLFYESVYPDFTSLSADIPAGAQTANTMFRWMQLGIFAAGQDNWVLDDVYIGEINTNNFDYTWSPSLGLDADDISDPIASPLNTTLYYVEMTDAQSGCIYTDSIFVNVGQPFALDMTPDTVLCDVQGIQLQAEPDIDGDYSYLWTPNTTISSAFSATPTVTPSSTTTYAVTVTSSQGCTATGDVQITVNQLFDLDVVVSDQEICAGETISLDAIVNNSNGITFEWTPDDWLTDPNSSSTDATPYANITYTVTATHNQSGCQLTESVPIEVTQLFSVQIDPQDTALCITDGFNLVASTSYQGQLTWQWSPANLVEDDNLPDTYIVGDQTADFVIIATDPGSGCGAADTAHVELLIETTNLGPDQGFCEDQFVNLNSQWPSTYSFLWSTNETSSAITVNEDGTYWVQVTSPLGCESYDQVDLTEYFYPVVALGPDTAMCVPELYTINAGNPGLNYLWSTGETTQTITVNSTDDYSVTVDNGYCYTSDDVTVVVNPLPTNQLVVDTAICFGYPPYFLDLNAGNLGSTYSWSTGESSQELQVTSPGIYTVDVTTEFGCSKEFIAVIGENCTGVIYIPNTMTPNGDGLNDVWFVYGEFITEFKVRIWNRWGELIWENDDLSVPWQGEHRNGETYVQNDVYVYQVIFKLKGEHGMLSDEAEKWGHITVIR